MKIVSVHKQSFQVQDFEFLCQPKVPEISTLTILADVAPLDRLVGFLRDTRTVFDGVDNASIMFDRVTHGGYVAIKSAPSFQHVAIATSNHHENLMANLAHHQLNESVQVTDPTRGQPSELHLLFLGDLTNVAVFHPTIVKKQTIVVAPMSHVLKTLFSDGLDQVFTLRPKSPQEPGWFVYVPERWASEFRREFRFYVSRDNRLTLDYDNLLHYTMIVKDAGDTFEQVLTEMLPCIDRWTILDTGSTDNTVATIQKVLGNHKKGTLYQEPFINFRESRNRCLDLAALEGHCTFTMMLDDTYVVKGDLKGFLSQVRGDQTADSFSLFIKSDDVEYTSNRIIKTDRQLRYVHTLHEIINPTNNINVQLFMECAHILDQQSAYMSKRSQERKRYDLQMLFEELQQNPTDSRQLYYIAQTYTMLEEYEKAYEYYMLRVMAPQQGYVQERVDSYFEAARTLNHKATLEERARMLGREGLSMEKWWDRCFELYMAAFDLDPRRSDPLYYIGIHYQYAGNHLMAFKYFKDAFQLGYSVESSHSLKPTIYYKFLPLFLVELCHECGEYALGKQAADVYLNCGRNPASTLESNRMSAWSNLFGHMLNLQRVATKRRVAFIADGGWGPWSGNDALTVGGSESFIIELARQLQSSQRYEVTVFCNCRVPSIDAHHVQYVPLGEPMYRQVVASAYHAVIVSRYAEYVSMVCQLRTQKVYYLLHDIGVPDVILSTSLTGVICLTEWHRRQFLALFPMFEDRTHVFHHGINTDIFSGLVPFDSKIPRKFIYSSFPNRGLLTLLRMWPRIHQRFPDATLDLFCDLEGAWVNRVYTDGMSQIRSIVRQPGVTVHGWCNKTDLAAAWARAQIWFYPTDFDETFCLTALEAALTGTLAVTSDRAALKETVGDRGIVIPGDPTSPEWQEAALRRLFEVMAKPANEMTGYLEANRAWALSHAWDKQAKEFEEKFL